MERKAAPIVKCEHCNWKGSARGIFTHVRLSHPGIIEKPPIAVLQHPLDVNTKQTIIGNVKRKRVRYNGIEQDINDIAMIGLALALVIKVIDLIPVKNALKSEGINPNKVTMALGKLRN